MNANQISVQFDRLNDVANGMNNVINALDSAKGSIDRIVGNMGNIWEGRARNNYRDDTKVLTKRIETFKEEIRERKEKLEQAVGVYKQTEETNVNKVSDLSVEGIF